MYCFMTVFTVFGFIPARTTPRIVNCFCHVLNQGIPTGHSIYITRYSSSDKNNQLSLLGFFPEYADIVEQVIIAHKHIHLLYLCGMKRKPFYMFYYTASYYSWQLFATISLSPTKEPRLCQLPTQLNSKSKLSAVMRRVNLSRR